MAPGHLAALALAGIGINCLRVARTEFTDETRRDLIHALERYEAEREPLGEIEQRDAKWEAACGQQGVDHSGDGEIPDEDLVDEDSDIPVTQQRSILQAISEFFRLPQAQKQTIHNEQELRELAVSRLLTVDLALRCHHHRYSRFPGSLADLSSEFLTIMPDDPFTTARFIYRPHDTSFMLYSLGPDKMDDGGNFGPWICVAGGGYDLSLDGEDYQPTGRHALPGPSLLRRLWSRIFQRPDH
ncbi:MAG: hypothetical protein U1A77_16760 [Pirellulales bacterium]